MGRSLLSNDTSREAERVQIALWRAMSPLEKTRIVSAVTRAAQELCLTGIRQRHPGASSSECRAWLARHKLGVALARRVYGDKAQAAES